MRSAPAHSHQRALPVALLLATLAGLVTPGCQDDTALLAEAYVEAHDDRAEAFCRCFGPLLGYQSVGEDGETYIYTDRDRDRCASRERYAERQRLCMVDMFTSSVEFAPDDALECLRDVESEYARCLDELACDDLAGFDACTTEFNAATNACPRLTEDDEESFVNCHFI